MGEENMRFESFEIEIEIETVYIVIFDHRRIGAYKFGQSGRD
jgi:hypothetical protein